MHLLLVEDDERLGRALTPAPRGGPPRRRASRADGRDRPRARRRRTTASTPSSSTSGCRTCPASTWPAACGATRSTSSILMLTARDTVERPGDRPRRGRRRLRREAVRLRGARRAPPCARPPRRAGPPAARSRGSRSAPITLDEAARRVTVNGRDVDLSPREFSLLECLLRHPGQVLTRDQLLDQAWPFGVAVTPNAVDAYVHYLRDEARRRRAAGRDGPRHRVSPRRWLTARRLDRRDDDRRSRRRSPTRRTG